jgi:hypothetical protein
MTTYAPYRGPNRRRSRPSPLVVGLAVLAVAAVAFVTLCPIGLRPHLTAANAERFDAYLVLGVLVGLAAGRRGLTAAAFVVSLAIALEAAQVLAPGRHAAVSDAFVKALGGVFGVAAVQISYSLRRLLARVGDFSLTPTSGRRA